MRDQREAVEDIHAARTQLLQESDARERALALQRRESVDRLLEALRDVELPIPSRWARWRCLLFGHQQTTVPWCWRCWSELE